MPNEKISNGRMPSEIDQLISENQNLKNEIMELKGLLNRPDDRLQNLEQTVLQLMKHIEKISPNVSPRRQKKEVAQQERRKSQLRIDSKIVNVDIPQTQQ